MTYAHDSLFNKIAERLCSNPGFHLGELARELGIDRHTLLKAVKLNSRESFRAFQKRKRVEAVMGLLDQAGELSEKQIAAKVGLSADALSRFVRREKGKTLSAIRKNAGGNE